MVTRGESVRGRMWVAPVKRGANRLRKGEIGPRSLFGHRGGGCSVESGGTRGQGRFGQRCVVDYQLTRWSNSYSGIGSGALGSWRGRWSKSNCQGSSKIPQLWSLKIPHLVVN